MRTLPPLYCLVAFEASARLMSFTRAAKELSLSQSAVSRQILQLEDFLGRALFERTPLGLRLTSAGERYGEEIRGVLDLCTTATNQAMARGGRLSLTVACSSGFADRWLAPHLKEFITDNPETEIRLLVRDDFWALTASEYDVGVFQLHHSPPPWTAVQRIFSERVFPVCSPDYLGERQLSPEELVNCTLLTLEDAERNWMSWPSWFALAQVQLHSTHTKIVCNRYSVILGLAVEGQGVALGWDNIIDPLLQSGALVRASKIDASLGGAFYLTWPTEREHSLPARRFRAWIEKSFERGSNE